MWRFRTGSKTPAAANRFAPARVTNGGGGGGSTLKSAALVAVPPGAVTRILPVEAFAGTVACTSVAEVVTKVAASRLNVTEVVPVKLLPVIVTWVPGAPLVGAKDAMVGGGGGGTVKSSALVAVPLGAVTRIFPVEAVAGTVAWISVAESVTKLATARLNVTEVVPVKLSPVIVT